MVILLNIFLLLVTLAGNVALRCATFFDGGCTELKYDPSRFLTATVLKINNANVIEIFFIYHLFVWSLTHIKIY